MFKELFAICLLVENFDTSLKFYRDRLGLELNSVSSKFADFKLNGTSLAIFEKSEAVSMFSEDFMKVGGSCVIAFQVENIKECVAKLSSKGIEVFEGPKVTSWGQKVAYFLDPDKNIWEVSQML